MVESGGIGSFVDRLQCFEGAWLCVICNLDLLPELPDAALFRTPLPTC
jgi:hypothetical protein